MQVGQGPPKILLEESFKATVLPHFLQPVFNALRDQRVRLVDVEELRIRVPDQQMGFDRHVGVLGLERNEFGRDLENTAREQIESAVSQHGEQEVVVGRANKRTSD